MMSSIKRDSIFEKKSFPSSSSFCRSDFSPFLSIFFFFFSKPLNSPIFFSLGFLPNYTSIFYKNHQETYCIFPQINPLDAYYLLNPNGDLEECQARFEKSFRNKNLEGKAGSAPTAKELAVALESHDLFIYFGHGSGWQYISRRDLLKLEKCAAAFLMGCSSGSLSLNGCYRPEGTPLFYLLAGSPLIVGNLWDVSSRDIVRFGKAMLDALFRERESLSVGCDQCTLLVEEVDAQNIRGCKDKKRNVSKVKKTGTSKTGYNGCDHRPKHGSFRGQASEACVLEFLTGAAPVCYGVPTGLRKGSGGRPGFGHGGGGYGAAPSGSGFP